MTKRPKKANKAKRAKGGRRAKTTANTPSRRRPSTKTRASKLPRKRAPVRTTRLASQEPTGGQVRDALKAVDHAHRQLELSGQLLLKSLADIQESVLAAQRAKMWQTLVSENLLKDLSDMRAALEDIGEEQLPHTLRPFLLLPQALGDWFAHSLGIKPIFRLGQELEIPREQLGDFSVSSAPLSELSALVRIRVTSQGWRSPTETLVKPSAVLLADAAPARQE